MARTQWHRALVAVVSLGMLAACGGDGDAPAEVAGDYDGIVEAAKSEGTMVWYTSLPDETADAVLAAFTDKHGVKTEKVRLSSSLLTARISTELSTDTVNADVVTAADPAFYEDAVQQGWIGSLAEADLPALESWPSDYLTDDTYALINIQPAAISYNPEKIDGSQVDSWEKLTAPELKGQIFYTDPTKVPSWLALAHVLHQEYGDDFMRDFGANLEFVDSLVPGAQSLAAGSGTVLAPSLVAVTDPLIADGAPIENVFPTVTTGVEQFAAVLEGAQHPNAALLFTDFLLSEEGQIILNKDSGSSPLGDLPGTIPLPSGYVSPDIAAATAAQDELLELMGK